MKLILIIHYCDFKTFARLFSTVTNYGCPKKEKNMKILFLALFLTTQVQSETNQSPWGMNYFTFWEGHSLDDGKTAKNELGGRLDDGLQMFNLVSTTYKLNDRFGLDLQKRIEHIPMTYRGDKKGDKDTEASWRFQGLRLGVSGKLLSGEKWSLRGALNTDVPELNGRDARYRKTILNPGLFAGLNYQFNPRWSLYAILAPRIFFYTDDEAVEPEWTAARRDPGEKPRLILAASPSINYAINDVYGMRGGLDLSFRQFVESEPTYLKRWPTSASLGPTFAINKHIHIWTYVMAWPFDGKKTHIETTSWGAWVSGVLF